MTSIHTDWELDGQHDNRYSLSAAKRATYMDEIEKQRLRAGPNRPLNMPWVRKLARNWTDMFVGVLEVRPHPNDPDLFRVIIGGHRLAAAMQRDDVVKLPCKVHIEITEAEDAALWEAEAKRRKRPTPVDLFWNALRQEQKCALDLAEWIKAIDRQIGESRHSTVNNVVCFKVLAELYPRDAAVLQRIFPLLGELCKGRIFHELVLRGVFDLERRLSRCGNTLDTPYWRGRVIKVGYDKIAEQIKRDVPNGRGSDKRIAEAILGTLNYRLHAKRLIAAGINDDT